MYYSYASFDSFCIVAMLVGGGAEHGAKTMSNLLALKTHSFNGHVYGLATHVLAWFSPAWKNPAFNFWAKQFKHLNGLWGKWD